MFAREGKSGADENAIEQYIHEIHKKRSATKLAAQSGAAKHRMAEARKSSGVSAAVNSKIVEAGELRLMARARKRRCGDGAVEVHEKNNLERRRDA